MRGEEPGVLLTSFTGRVLPITQKIAERWGVLEGECRARGVTIGTADGLIAATAYEHGLTVATRNVRDFEPMGVVLLHPWD